MDVQRHLAAISSFCSPIDVRRGSIAVAVSLAVLLFAACSSGTTDSTPVPVTANPQPTATATTAIAPEPSPTTPVATFTVADVSYPSCDTGSRHTSGSLGTAPGPTPTPVPDIGSRDAELVSSELSEYFSEAIPVVNHVVDWNDAFNSEWSASLKPSEQAEVLQVLGSRASLACDAVARIANVPIEAAGFDALLREAIRVRHAWAGSAIEQLVCCGNGVSTETDIGNSDTLKVVAQLPVESAALIQQYDASTRESLMLSDSAIGIEVAVEVGWLISADGLSPLLLAPFELNRPDRSGLGPERWQIGSAVRIRRLRNPEPITALQASSRFTALVTQQGSVAMTEETSVGGVAALRHILSPEHQLWSSAVTVLVAGDFTYFVETGCPSDVTGACDAVDAVATSLKPLP